MFEKYTANGEVAEVAYFIIITVTKHMPTITYLSKVNLKYHPSITNTMSRLDSVSRTVIAHRNVRQPSTINSARETGMSKLRNVALLWFYNFHQFSISFMFRTRYHNFSFDNSTLNCISSS